MSQLDEYQTRNQTVESLKFDNRKLSFRSIKLRDEKNKLSHERQKSCFMADHPVIVTTYGLAKNEYSSRIQRVITMDDLFL